MARKTVKDKACDKKNDEVLFEFDNMLKPVSFTTNGETKKYSVREEVKREFTSPLRMETEGKL